MRLILCVFAIFTVMLAAPTAGAQEPYHVFKFSPKAGFYKNDSAKVGTRLLAGERIIGDVKLTRCEETEEWGAGFRLQILDSNTDEHFLIGFMCSEDTGGLEFGFVRLRGEQGAEFLSSKALGTLDQRRGDRVELSALLEGRTLQVSFGKAQYSYELDFDPDAARYMTFGTTGQARFFELAPLVS